MTTTGRGTGRRSTGTDVIPVLRSLRELGRFDEAATLVHESDPRSMSAPLHSAAGSALAAVSEYDAAAVHLLLAAADPAVAPAALGLLAELSWIRHDHVRGRAFALEGLAIDPSDRACRIQLYRNENGSGHGRSGSRGRLAHAAYFAEPQGDAGDRAVVDAVRRCLRTGTGPDRWHDVHVHQLFDDRRLAEVNAANALVVGGGGLFLPDVAPNGNSGWQWNVPDAVLRRIDVPLVVFGVGYDLFEGQLFEGRPLRAQLQVPGTRNPQDGDGLAGGPRPTDLRGSRFVRSLRTLVEHAAFVGLRNHGSVQRVRELLPAELAGRIHWQPCPTAIAGLLGDSATAGTAVPGTAVPVAGVGESGAVIDLRGRETRPDDDAASETGAVLLNCAYDRVGRRFGDSYGAFLAELRDWVLSTRELAPVHYVAHSVDDERFVSDLRREHGLTLPVIPLYDRDVAGIQRTYRRARLVVGMRGHAAMIPFGLGTPIISLISHPELGYFLDDIGRPEWGLSIREPDLGQRLRELTTRLLDSHQHVVDDIGRIQDRLYAVTMQNVRSLPAVLHPGER